MKSTFVTLVLLMFFLPSFGQKKGSINITKKLPNFISDADRRKVDKAKRLLNEGKILEGEKILIALRDENMNQAYFHEALVQIQKQILDFISFQDPPIDQGGEYFLDENDLALQESSLEENFISNGLARTPEQLQETIDNIRLASKEKKKLKKAVAATLPTEEEEALNPIEAAKLEIDKENSQLRTEEERRKSELLAVKKEAQRENDFSMIPYESYAYQLLNASRLATLKHERVDSSSHYLRTLTVDTVRYDSLMSLQEIDLFSDALDYYYSSDYRRASQILEQLTQTHENHFPSQHYLAQAYFNMGLDTPTLLQYIVLAQKFKERPEGLVGLSEYFLAKGQFKKAAASIIKAIAIYPEDAYFALLDNILKRSGKMLNSQWIRREVYPLSTARNFEEIIAEEESPWRYYQNAGVELHSYASPEGIIRTNEITNERYLELYAWKEMLKEHDALALEIKDPKKRAEYLAKNNANKEKKEEPLTFPFARSMQKMGMLDCYIFITLFHNDLYPAFKEFVMLHPDKIEKYFNVLLNWEDKKFDPYRVGIKSSPDKPREKVK